MATSRALSPEELASRTARFFSRYGQDLEQIRDILAIRLRQLALAYTIQNKLPPEAIVVRSRVKSQSSFLKKLERKGWPQFYYLTEVAQDLLGARVVCWFVDDCTGMLEFIKSSNHLTVHENVEDYIANPKQSGYRSIHILAGIGYDAVRHERNRVIVADDKMACEIQIRTKLQDSFGDVTHEFHYKAGSLGVKNAFYERMLSEASARLASEDRSLMALRDAYQELAEEKLRTDTREGFREN